ncbi:SoxR reducing system RseC family protein [bacterium]|nr:SoxR reducing system RseC family protein [bacterium]MBU4561024.1 SoxR reducing system RseC family protein [bacterium]MCG2676555.1 SoxR reducing system RseC family protein [bacterium]MCG2677087.1 SoxR reducing system RseC family protein [bacterium]
MEEEGIVIEIKGNLAQVEIKRKSACGTCRACTLGTGNTMITEAENPLGARIGQRVKVEISSREILKGAFLIYIFPLLALILGMVLGITITNRLGLKESSQTVGLVLGLVFLVLSFVLIWRYNKKVKDQSTYRSKIIQIIESEK